MYTPLSLGVLNCTLEAVLTAPEVGKLLQQESLLSMGHTPPAPPEQKLSEFQAFHSYPKHDPILCMDLGSSHSRLNGFF